MIADVLHRERFAMTAELGPPAAPDLGPVRETARVMSAWVDAVNVTDNQAASVKMSPLACCVELIRHGVDPIMQLTARDRNLLALQSDLIGAWALGVRAVMTLGGDPLTIGRYHGVATPVGDVDAAGLTQLVRAMNRGQLAASERLEPATDFIISAALNPFRDTCATVRGKIGAGVRILQSNVVYDVLRFGDWLGSLVEQDAFGEIPVLVGVMPPRSSRMLRYMHERIPGVEVDAATFARMEGLDGDRAKAEGLAIATEIIDALAEVPGVTGVHVMAPGWELEAVPSIAATVGRSCARAASCAAVNA